MEIKWKNLIGPISFLAIYTFVLFINVIFVSKEISYPPLNFLINHSTHFSFYLYSTFYTFGIY